MAGVAGFEPTNDGVRVRCLTAWRHPNVRLTNHILSNIAEFSKRFCPAFENFFREALTLKSTHPFGREGGVWVTKPRTLKSTHPFGREGGVWVTKPRTLKSTHPFGVGGTGDKALSPQSHDCSRDRERSRSHNKIPPFFSGGGDPPPPPHPYPNDPHAPQPIHPCRNPFRLNRAKIHCSPAAPILPPPPQPIHPRRQQSSPPLKCTTTQLLPPKNAHPRTPARTVCTICKTML